jgi:hypothetical protein
VINREDYRELFYFFSIERLMYQLKQIPKIRMIFLNFLPIKLLLTRYDIDIKLKRDILIFQSMDRADYNDFMDKILTVVPLNSKRVLLKIKFSPNIDFLKIPDFDYLEAWSLIYRYEISFFEKIHTYLLILYHASVLSQLKKIKENPKYIILHADMQPLENMIAQFFKNRGVPTVTLQHGLYVDYTKLPNINVCSYKHVVSDYFLAWGEETKRLIERYHPECNIVICGKPSKSIKYKPNSSGVFVVLFDGEIFQNYNRKLLAMSQRLAKDTDRKIYLRLHPANKIEDYNVDESLILQEDNFDMYQSEFVLGHTTSMIYELMRVGMPVLKYKTNIPANSISDDLIFSSYKELRDKVKRLDLVDFVSEGRDYIKYIDDKSLLKYKKFFYTLSKFNI